MLVSYTSRTACCLLVLFVISGMYCAYVGLTSTEIINICWEHDPSRRPTFDHIYLALCTLRRKLNPAFEETEEERAAREQIVRAKVQAAATVAAKIKSPGPMPLKTEGAQAR